MDKLVIGLRIVRGIARRLHKRLPPNVELDDLIGAGTIGLMTALERHDGARDFEPYAARCIRYAMLDELRVFDHLTRAARWRRRTVDSAIDLLTDRLGRPPADDEVADWLGVSLGAYQRQRAELANGGAVDVDAVAHAIECHAPRADDDLLRREQRTRLAAARRRLSPRKRNMLALHFDLGVPQARIAKTYGITESRVCQILKETTRELRGHLDA